MFTERENQSVWPKEGKHHKFKAHNLQLFKCQIPDKSIQVDLDFNRL